MSYIALYQGTASEAAEKVRNADSSWAEAHSEWQEERTCTAHLKVRPFKTHGKCLFSAASSGARLRTLPEEKRHVERGCFCTDLPQHSRDLPAMIGAVIDYVLHLLRQRQGKRLPDHVGVLQGRLESIFIEAAQEL